MAKASNQKQKILYLAKYFLEKTDEHHLVSTPQLIEYLEANDIKAERKSIYDDIDTLIDFGFDIVKIGGAKGGYFLASRDFELAEVKLLVDLVQAAKFITTKKSRELTKKLEKQVSTYEAKALQRQIVVSNRGKAVNENIYYSVDKIYEAIAQNVKVCFQYFEWDVDKKEKLRRDGKIYEVSPWLLTWDNENYYLVAYDDCANTMKHYRVDKMLHIEVSDQKRKGKEAYDNLNVSELSRRTFGMFSGEERTVSLLCDASLTSVCIDRFGKEVALRTYDETHVLARADVEVSPQFFGWVSGFGNRMKIHAPEDVAASYQEYLEEILKEYQHVD